MAKDYKVSAQLKPTEEIEQTLVFKRKLNAYVLSTSSKAIQFKVVDKEEYFRYSAGEVNHIFPEYDPNKHYIDVNTYNPENIGYDGIPISLYEYQQSNHSEVPYGTFIFEQNNNYGLVLKKITLKTDNHINLNSKFNLIDDFNNFRLAKPIYKSTVGRARKGLLFYGPPGGGKSHSLTCLAQLAEKEKFRVFFITKGFSLQDLIPFKRIFENEDNVFVIEELTDRANNSSDTEELLSFMDGEMSWDNSYVIATTNYPEELPWNIIDRPSRFKVKLEFPNPTLEERINYLTQMKVSEDQIQEAAKITEGLSLDYLKNITMDSFIENRPIVEIMKDYKKDKLNIASKFKNGKLGI